MATNKKSVLLYCDIIHTVEKMDNETAGIFFKHYLNYINDNDPTTDNLIVDIAFESVKQNLKRDLIKWEQRAEKSRENGKLGGRPKEPKEPSGLINNLDEPKEPVTVKVTVTDIVKVKDTYREFAHLKLSQDEYNRLLKDYTPTQINDTLDNIENYKNNTNYTSLNLTLRKWLKKEYVAKQTEETISERIERLNREHKAMG